MQHVGRFDLFNSDEVGIDCQQVIRYVSQMLFGVFGTLRRRVEILFSLAVEQPTSVKRDDCELLVGVDCADYSLYGSNKTEHEQQADCQNAENECFRAHMRKSITNNAVAVPSNNRTCQT